MMGKLNGQGQLFYQFRLDDHVPADHLLAASTRCSTSPSIPCSRPTAAAWADPRSTPELMLRMLLVGYLYGIRSERRLCDEVHLNRHLVNLVHDLTERGTGLL